MAWTSTRIWRHRHPSLPDFIDAQQPDTSSSPPTLRGQSTFYEALQRYPWYYVPWKWEHEIAKSYLKDGDQVLEVGCGSVLLEARQ